MHLRGLKLNAEDIYDVNNSSLKDAVVIFGGGCTGEIISPEGLLLTNHHCGYGVIQSHSSVEHDYLSDGYWAMNRDEELHSPGLKVTFIDRIEEVTDQVLNGVNESMDAETRDKQMAKNIQEIEGRFKDDKFLRGDVKSFYFGNQYIMFVLKEYIDIRMVGAPPSSIGKYGFDTDNWVWPRHTGDFSIFRIYAGKDNEPAEHSSENIPYKPKHHLPISLNGYDEGDFTMVYGFPFNTDEYLTSVAVDHIVNVSNPRKIEIRTAKLNVLNERMRNSNEVRIKYAAKQSSTSNAWKKWQGQNRGLRRNDALEKKQKFEEKLKFKIDLYPDSFSHFSGVLEEVKDITRELNEVSLAREEYIEIGYYGIDALQLGYRLLSFYRKAQEGKLEDGDLEKISSLMVSHFKNYDKKTDQQVFEALMPLYLHSTDNFYKPDIIKEIHGKEHKNIGGWLKETYSESVLTNQEELHELIRKGEKGIAKLDKDELFNGALQLNNFYSGNISPVYKKLKQQLSDVNRRYFTAIKAVFPEDVHYADANGTLRLTYGKVQGMSPANAIKYNYYTTFDGVIEKYIPDSYEYNLPDKLLELHRKGEYGRYAQDGDLRVCFIASNHTSGGNSGSPVLNGEGHLIGLNFDRNWEGTMSDIMYDINQCRNISVDIRYVLFIIDEFAEADHLIEEMSIIEPKELDEENIKQGQ